MRFLFLSPARSARRHGNGLWGMQGRFSMGRNKKRFDETWIKSRRLLERCDEKERALGSTGRPSLEAPRPPSSSPLLPSLAPRCRTVNGWLQEFRARFRSETQRWAVTGSVRGSGLWPSYCCLRRRRLRRRSLEP